jgi:hypothetical protein
MFSSSYHAFRSEIEFLEKNRFIDAATRAVFVDSILYNPSFGLYTIVRLVFECFETGGVASSAQIATYRSSPLHALILWLLSVLHNKPSQIRHVYNAIGRFHCVLGGHCDALYPAVPLRGVFGAEQGDFDKPVTCAALDAKAFWRQNKRVI